MRESLLVEKEAVKQAKEMVVTAPIETATKTAGKMDPQLTLAGY